MIRGWSTSPKGVQPGEEKAPGTHYGGLKKATGMMGRDSWPGGVVTRQGGMALN